MAGLILLLISPPRKKGKEERNRTDRPFIRASFLSFRAYRAPLEKSLKPFSLQGGSAAASALFPKWEKVLCTYKCTGNPKVIK